MIDEGKKEQLLFEMCVRHLIYSLKERCSF